MIPQAQGIRRALVILGRFTDHAPNVTDTAVMNLALAADAWLREISHGHASVGFAVTPWLDLGIPRPPPQDGSGLCDWKDRAKAAALAAGFDPGSYDFRFFCFDAWDSTVGTFNIPALYGYGTPTGECGGKVPDWDGGEISFYTTAQLNPLACAQAWVGYAVGLRRDGYLICGDGPDSIHCSMGSQVPFTGDPAKWHFGADGRVGPGSIFSLMGGGPLLHPGPIGKVALGWADVTNVSASGTFTIRPYEQTGHVLKVWDYNLIFRRQAPTAYPWSAPASSVDGVFFHLPRSACAINVAWHELEQAAEDHMLDVNPDPRSGLSIGVALVCQGQLPPPVFDPVDAARDCALHVGKLWFDQLHKVRFGVLATSDAGAVVQVTGDFQAPTCTITSPTGGTVKGKVKVAMSASEPCRFELWIDGHLYGTVPSPSNSATFGWNPSSGAHTLQAKAFDVANNVGLSQLVNVTR